VLYVGVGNTYAGLSTAPAANAVAALDLKTGKMVWAKQVAAPDIFGCRAGEPIAASVRARTSTFGSSPSLAKLPNGRDVIVIGNKSGIGYAMDPDKQGEILWSTGPGRAARSAGSSGARPSTTRTRISPWRTATAPHRAACMP
jgi:polyvinyl alcohol dehydrogenase (cytochrome)